MLSDEQTVLLVAKGDGLALAELYDRYNMALYNYALRLVRNREAAEDILQEVFVALWKNANGFQHRSSVKTWLFRITHYQTVTWLRSQNRFDESMVLLPEESETPEESSVTSWRVSEVQTALDRLSHKHRAVVELAFVHELPYAAIAEILDCPVGTVKSRMSYALKHLGSVLASHDLHDKGDGLAR